MNSAGTMADGQSVHGRWTMDNRPMGRVLVMAVLACAAVAATAAQAPLTRTGTIRGRVLDAQTGRPIERAIVEIRTMDRLSRLSPDQLTDANGNFGFERLPAGRF